MHDEGFLIYFQLIFLHIFFLFFVAEMLNFSWSKIIITDSSILHSHIQSPANTFHDICFKLRRNVLCGLEKASMQA